MYRPVKFGQGRHRRGASGRRDRRATILPPVAQLLSGRPIARRWLRRRGRLGVGLRHVEMRPGEIGIQSRRFVEIANRLLRSANPDQYAGQVVVGFDVLGL